MLNLKVARECDQALQEVHDLPQSTFGLETYVERLETLLTSERSDAAPRYVGVWGMGGVGKTLLLQVLYGSPKVKGHFQGAMFIWLTVGQTPDIMALYRTLSKNWVSTQNYMCTQRITSAIYTLSSYRKECSWFWMMFGETKHLIHWT
jgi:predicted ATPase